MGGPIIPQGLKTLLITSVAVHLGIILVASVVSGWQSQAAVTPRNAIATKLVRLGKKKPKENLPRLTQPPPPTAKPVPKIDNAAKPTPQTKTPSTKSALNRLKSSTASALSRLKNMAEEEPEGDPEGVEGGEVSDAALALLGSKFTTELKRCIDRFWEIRGTSRKAVRGRSAEVLIRVAPDGRFIDWRIMKKSGLAAFDRAVIRATSQCGKVSPPDARLRDELRKEGIQVNYRP